MRVFLDWDFLSRGSLHVSCTWYVSWVLSQKNNIKVFPVSALISVTMNFFREYGFCFLWILTLFDLIARSHTFCYGVYCKNVNWTPLSEARGLLSRNFRPEPGVHSATPNLTYWSRLRRMFGKFYEEFNRFEMVEIKFRKLSRIKLLLFWISSSKWR